MIIEQDRQNKTDSRQNKKGPELDRQNWTDKTGQAILERQNWTGETGQAEHDCHDRTSRTGLPE
jgi:hypothetical protein